MNLEMPRFFTDQPLSFKVEPLKSYAKKLYVLIKHLGACYWQVRVLSEDESLRDSEVQLM